MNVVGLMSGTSMDGIAAALVNIEEKDGFNAKLIDWKTTPYPEDVKKRLMKIAGGGKVSELCRLNFEVGELFAQAANKLIEESDRKVDLIGSHGQTVFHLPRTSKRKQAYTLQIGEPDVIAERTGITTVGDFRPRDIAAGGEGAPLIPFVDYKLFRSPSENRVGLNIGGISNVTYLPAGGSLDNVLAFDTGPGNMVLDQLMRDISGGEKEYDEDGNLAASGEVNPNLLDWLMEDEFVAADPPKSTGREDFGRDFAKRVKNRSEKLNLEKSDLIATVTAFTAESIKINCKSHLGKVDKIIAAGGGTKNDTLMKEIERRFETEVKTTADYGIPVESKEAMGFAILALETYRGRPSNVPNATGASKHVPQGKISLMKGKDYEKKSAGIY